MKYKLKIIIRKGMEDTPFGEEEIDDEHFCESFQLRRFSTFKDDAYLVFTLEPLPEPEAKAAE